MSVPSIFSQISTNRVVAITGNAAAGKSTLARMLTVQPYSIDYRFIGDSQDRQRLMKEKALAGLTEYVDACNQYNWWNWDSVEADLRTFDDSGELLVLDPYNRDTGQTNPGGFIHCKTKPLVIEGAILGPPSVLARCERIFFVYEPPETRLARLLRKDAYRRSTVEICSRFLVTEYSENMYYRNVLSKYRLQFVNTQYEEIPEPEHWIRKSTFIPFNVELGFTWTQ